MSDQTKSNLQTFGAGLLGFVAVVAIGGGALMLRSSGQPPAGSKPVPAAEPIDLGASMPRPPESSALVRRENRVQSPAPLIGAEGESDAAEAPAAGGRVDAAAAAPSPESRNGDTSAARLEATAHSDSSAGGSTAAAVVKNTVAHKKEKTAKLAVKKTALARMEPAAGGGDAVASVHYGVTSRSELMGRAAGPVYNFKGAGGKAGSVAAGKMADAGGKIADLRKQLDAAGLPADQRAKMLQDLDQAMKDLAAPAKTDQ